MRSGGPKPLHPSYFRCPSSTVAAQPLSSRDQRHSRSFPAGVGHLLCIGSSIGFVAGDAFGRSCQVRLLRQLRGLQPLSRHLQNEGHLAVPPLWLQNHDVEESLRGVADDFVLADSSGSFALSSGESAATLERPSRQVALAPKFESTLLPQAWNS